jgi:glycosyltransferase involved in cell wall biosynthesis
MMQVDHWCTGQHMYVMQLPLVEALRSSGLEDMRIVYPKHSPGLEGFQSLGLPECQTAGAATKRGALGALLGLWRTRQRLAQFYKTQSENHIVHITMISFWDIFYIGIAKRSGAKILLVIHDAERHAGEESRIMDWIEKQLIKIADDVAVLSPSALMPVRKRVAAPKPIHVVNPGLIVDVGEPSPAKLAPQGRPMRFLFFGRIHHYKGLDILLEAWSRFKQQENGPPATLSIVGSGNIEPYMQAISEAKDVTLEYGWISDARMAEVFENHDVNVMPYRDGSESANALTGMWAGMPAIATDVPCFDGKFINRVNALVTNISVDEVHSAIQELASSPALFSSLAKGTHKAAQNWTASAVAKNWKRVYADMLGQAAEASLK